jgi:hypothetical protein
MRLNGVLLLSWFARTNPFIEAYPEAGEITMYCSSCGTALQIGLKYCNRCGNRIYAIDESVEANQPIIKTDKVVDHLATVICFVAIFGFGALALIVTQLIKSGHLGEAMGFTGLILVTILFIAWLLVRQISGVLNFNRKVNGQPGDSRTVNSLRDTQPQPLEASGDVLSVTEHTTRNFEALYPERDAQ